VVGVFGIHPTQAAEGTFSVLAHVESGEALDDVCLFDLRVRWFMLFVTKLCLRNRTDNCHLPSSSSSFEVRRYRRLQSHLVFEPLRWPITDQFGQSMRQNHSTFSLIVSFPPAFAVSFIFSTNMSQSLFEASSMSLNAVLCGIEYSSVKGVPGCNLPSSSNPPTSKSPRRNDFQMTATIILMKVVFS
jgi:hypothetical protein